MPWRRDPSRLTTTIGRILTAVTALALLGIAAPTAAPTAGAADPPNPRVDSELWFAPGPTTTERAMVRFVAAQDGRIPPIYRGFVPLVGDFDGDGIDDLFWYLPASSVATYGYANLGGVWFYDAFGDFSVADGEWGYVGGAFEPVVGDFDGDRLDDIFWYDPGPEPDYLWTRRSRSVGGPCLRAWVCQRIDVGDGWAGGGFDPVAGDFDGDGRDDILWYASDATTVEVEAKYFRYEDRPDYVWYGQGGGRFYPTTFDIADVFVPGWEEDPGLTVGGRPGKVTLTSYGRAFQPVVADVNGDRRDDVVFVCGDSDERRRQLRAPAGWAANRPTSCRTSGLVVPAPTASYLYLGTPAGLRIAAATQLPARPLAAGGDFDGDGFGDVMLHDGATAPPATPTAPRFARGRRSAILAADGIPPIGSTVAVPALRPVTGDFGVGGATDIFFFD